MSSMTIFPKTTVNETYFFDAMPLKVYAENLSHTITISRNPSQDAKVTHVWQLAINDHLLELENEPFSLEGFSVIALTQSFENMITLTVEHDTDESSSDTEEVFVIYRSHDPGSQFRFFRDNVRVILA